MIDKALGLHADALFFDLEDGVPPDLKPEARVMVSEALGRPPGGPLRYVRINSAGSPWVAEDLRAVLVPGLDGLCLPKVEDAGVVEDVARRLDRFEPACGIEPGSIGIVAAVESALGLMKAADIAAASPRVTALMLGSEDFAFDLGLPTRREAEARELLYARSALVVAATAARVLAIDGVHADLGDDEGLLRDARQARRLGFGAKSLIHPKQIDVINRVFSPTPEEVAHAREVVQAFRAAQARGEGSVALGGQLVDLPIVHRAERMLAVAEQMRS